MTWRRFDTLYLFLDRWLKASPRGVRSPRRGLSVTTIAAIPAARISHSITRPTQGCEVGSLAVVGAPRICAALKDQSTEAPREDVSRCSHHWRAAASRIL